MNDYCVIFITAGSKEEAEKLSRGLVEKKLAFCVNTVPSIQSTYHWEGKIHVDNEILLIIKTLRRNYEELENWVKKTIVTTFQKLFPFQFIKGCLHI